MRVGAFLSRGLRRLVRAPLLFLAALLVLFEDFLWAWLDAALEGLARLPVVRRLEAAIARLPPYPAMALFLVPVVVLLPAHLTALWLAAIGHFGTAAAIYIAVKLVGTAMLARIFHLCQPALLSLRWFARLYAWVVDVKRRIYAQVEALPLWRAAKAVTARLREMLRRRRSLLDAPKSFLRRRWRNAPADGAGGGT
jgi:hypothetical protein